MQLLLISSSVVYGYGFLDHPEPEIRRFLDERRRVAFIPFALADHDAYTEKVSDRLGQMGLDVTQVHDANDLKHAEAIFVGGGNTFRLLKTLYERDMLDAIRERVRDGIPYIGSSAGTVIATPTIRTTNDMPIVFPPSFDALSFVEFQINPHYLDADPGSRHMGETREDRIREFLEENDVAVVGLREGSWLRVEGAGGQIGGAAAARVFRRGRAPEELATGASLAALLAG